MTKIALFVATSLAVLSAALSTAHATGVARAWVSGHGADAAGCGAPTNPCRSFQYVVANIIAPGGEIDVLDPAGYGAVTIPFALSIVNDGVGTAGVQQPTAGDNAITVNAGSSDSVALRGLNIDGLGTAANGIVFNSGGSLTVVNCVIRHFVGAGNGILIAPTSGSMSFQISNVVASDNAFAGVAFLPAIGTPSARGVIDHVTATNNRFGIYINTDATTGGSVTANISNDVASNNSSDGYFIETVAGGGQATVAVDNATASGNGDSGLTAVFTAVVLLSRSTLTSNVNYGVLNETTANTLYSYGDNRINRNGTDISGGLNTTDAPR